MKSKHLLALCLLAVTLLAGCKKDKDGENPANPGSGKQLKRIIETENGFTTNYTVSYDASKRLKSIESDNDSERTVFTYDNNGNVIKVENLVDDTKNIFEFYANGLPASGNFKSYEISGTEEILQETYDLAYTITNGLVTQIKTIYPDDPFEDTDGYEIDYMLTYTNGNLTQVVSDGLAVYNASFSYGNKKPAFPVAFKYIMDPFGFSMQFFAKNDILMMAFDHVGTELDNIIETTYTYDAQGYILTANDGQTQSRFEY